MDKLEELLPGIEKFLTITLAKEELSSLAEKQRLYYVERLDIIQLPPHLPPKPADGEKPSIMQGRKLPEPGKSKSTEEDFIAQQRLISRLSSNPDLKPAYDSTDNPVPNNGEGLDSDEYEDGLYEEPITLEDPSPRSSRQTERSSAEVVDSDVGSSTSYETYDEGDCDGPYSNVSYDDHTRSDIPLPRIKSKKKKKKPLTKFDRYYKQLQSIVHEGELYHRGKSAFTSAWTKRFCAICDGIFYCYKDRESKPVFSVSLHGYDVVLMEKEKGRTNVLRLSNPGCETHFLSTDSVNDTQLWKNKIDSVCCSLSVDSANAETSSSSLSHYHTGSQSSVENTADSAIGNGSPNNFYRKQMPDGNKKEKKGKITKFLAETFGKKKGQKVAQHLEISGSSLQDSKTLSPDISIAGVVKLCSRSLTDSSWQYKTCVIRNGVFECFKDDSNSSDLEFSLMLNDCELKASSDTERPLALCVNKAGEEALMIEPDNRLDHGSWLSAILKHVGNRLSSVAVNDDPDMNYTYVDRDEFLPQKPKPEYPEMKPMRSMEEERQYADLSDLDSPDESEKKLRNFSSDDPVFDVGNRKIYVSFGRSRVKGLIQKFDDSNVYEEVTEAESKVGGKIKASSQSLTEVSTTDSKPASRRNSGSKVPLEAVSQTEDTNQSEDGNLQKKKLDVASKTAPSLSPTSDYGGDGQAFSREGSVSSDSSNRRISDTVAKNKALFEISNSSGSGAKWTGYKLAGATPVKRTPSMNSQSSSNSANSSPRVSRSNSSITSSDKPENENKKIESIELTADSQVPAINAVTLRLAAKTAENPNNSKTQSPTRNLPKNINIGRAKAVFESNNNVIEKKPGSSLPQVNTKTSACSPVALTNTTEKSARQSGPISPIKISETEKPPPKFVSVFNSTISTTKVASSIPQKQENKTLNSNKNGTTDSIPLNTNDTVSTQNRIGVKATYNGVKKTQDVNKKITSSSNQNVSSKPEAVNFLSSALPKLSTVAPSDMGLKSLPEASSPDDEADDKKRLDDLRQQLIALRKERQKVRNQKLSTVLPEDRDKLDLEYKRIDSEYKVVQKEIEVLEDRNLQRIKDSPKDSIERRKLITDKVLITDKKKLWDATE